MANICGYSVCVSGPAATLDELQSLLVADTELLTDNDGQPAEWVVRFDTGRWGAAEQRFAYLDGNPGDLPPFHREGGRLYFSGDAKWSPSVEWMLAASARLPELEFSVQSTCESEHFQSWVVKAGRPELREERVYDVQRGMTHSLERQGRVIVDKAGVPIDDDYLDPARLGTSEQYRHEIVERLAILEQYVFALRSGKDAVLLANLAERMAASEGRIDELIARDCVESFDPVDDADREQMVANRRQFRRTDRDKARFPEAAPIFSVLSDAEIAAAIRAMK